jgi:hypothetical protein
MSKIKNFHKKNKSSLIIALVLSIINIIVVLIFGLHKISFENHVLSIWQITLSVILFVCYIAFCIFMQIKRYSTLAKGIFFYQLFGFLSYALYFFFFLFGIRGQSLLYTLFHSWTIYLEPLGVFLGRIGGIKAKYIVAMLYLLLTYVLGRTIIAIRKDISYEKQYREDHNITD